MDTATATDPPSAPRSPAPAARAALPARSTARSVLLADRAAGVFVRLGGVLVVVAVVGILVFLVATVWPLFQAAQVHPMPVAGRVPVSGPVRLLAVDEHGLLACAVGDAPEVVFFRLDTGDVVHRAAVPGFEGTTLTCAHRSVRGEHVVLGAADGRLAFLGLGFRQDFVLGAEADALRRDLAPDEVRATADGVVRRQPGGSLLRVRPAIEVRGFATLPAGAGAATAVGYASPDGDGVAAAVAKDGSLHFWRETSGGAAAGGPPRDYRPLPVAERGPGVPGALFAALVDEDARIAWFVSHEGAVLRVDVSATPAVRREVKFVGEPGRTRLAAAELLVGGRSLVLSDAVGGVGIWSQVPEESDAGAPKDPSGALRPADGHVLGRLRAFDPFPSPVETIACCPTRRTFYLGHRDGRVSLAYAANGRVLGQVVAFRAPVTALACGPRDDSLFVVGPSSGFQGFAVRCPHPEVNFEALFLPIHYEGYAKPALQYQSSASSDEAEPKLSLIPLVFGTAKATFYSMLFALPLALLGALYTSQFMHPSVRAVVKPGVEVMASLPSVVLGFIAALVIAPAVAGIVPAVFAAVAGIALVAVLAGFAWYLVPPHVRQGVGSAARLLLACGLVAATAFAAVRLNPAIQRALFSGEPANPTGDFRVWLEARPGTGSGLPVLRVALFFAGSALGIFLLPTLWRVRASALGRVGEGFLKALVYAVLPGAVLGALAGPLEHAVFRDGFRWFLAGHDATGRGTVYDQRNSLVVGLAMGFAVIPIVYTIAEDALSAIPDSLRSAALGCGASPWQTAVRVVLPAAAPGIFSAAMIGLGRAVGETMIVLMAAGGTPILDASLFNGFRTLSANIATELPEAPQDGTLYRVLFLAGLLLFALTFVLNTAAEAVRIRFRRRFKVL